MELNFKISPKSFTRVLLFIVSTLLILHILYIVSRFFYGYSYRDYLKIFYLDDEGNIPTLYATISIAIASILLFIVGFIKKKLNQEKYGYWYFLGVLFMLLSYDEAASMHEHINDIFWDKYPDLPAYLGFGWVIPYFILLIIFGLFFFKFIKSLPRRTAILFIFAGAVFVTGAMGMEFIGAYLWATAGGQDSLLYNFFATLEELLEMLGIVLFIYAILDYIDKEYGDIININFESTSKNTSKNTIRV
jgi:hypothetical protein